MVKNGLEKKNKLQIGIKYVNIMICMVLIQVYSETGMRIFRFAKAFLKMISIKE